MSVVDQKDLRDHVARLQAVIAEVTDYIEQSQIAFQYDDDWVHGDDIKRLIADAAGCKECGTITATHYADICEHDEIHDQPSPLQRDGIRYSREDD